MSRRRLTIIAFAALAAVIAGFFGSRAAVASLLGASLHCSVGIDAVTPRLGALDVHGLHVRSCDAPVLLDAASAQIGAGRLVLDDAQLRVTVQAGAPGDAQAALDVLARFPQTVTMHGGSALLETTGDHAAELALANVNGTIRRSGSEWHYDVTFVPEGGAPVHATAVAAAGGGTLHRLRTTLLPLASLAAPVALFAPAVVPSSGELSDVDVRYLSGPQGGLDGAATVHAGGIAFGAHRLHALEGTLSLHADTVASRDLAGKLDDATATLRGALHVFPHAHGGDDLVTLAELVGHVAVSAATDPILGPLRTASFEALAPGLLYADASMTTTNGPRVIHVLAADPREPTIRLDTALAQDRVVSHGEQTSTLARRTGAAAGVNGDYFDIGRTYESMGMYAHDGVLVRSPSEHSVLSVMRDGRVAVGTYYFGGTVRDGAREYRITRMNDFADYVSVITPELGTLLPGPNPLTFAELQPVDGAPKQYRVVRVSPLTGPEPARFGLTFGPFIKERLPKAGDVLELDYHTTPSLENVWAAVGGGHQVLRDGTWYEDPHPIAADEREVRWPVIAAGRLSDDRILFVAVDGRHPERAVGMTRPEFAKLLEDYGVVDALAFDSGGSVTMVSRLPFGGPVAVRNRPSDDDGERFIANGLFVYSSAAPDAFAGPPTTATVPATSATLPH